MLRLKQHLRRFSSLAAALVMGLFPTLSKAEERDYSTMPPLMTMQDGSPVTTAEAFDARRQELLQLFADTMYGPIPTEGFDTAFETVEQGDALDGTAVRKQIKITVSNENGDSGALMLLILPKSEAPVPVVCGLSFASLPTVLKDPAILPSYAAAKYPKVKDEDRGAQAGMWCIREAVDRGYGVAVAFCDDFSPDNMRTSYKRVISLFDKAAFKTISAWAFGLQRMMDYLVTDAQVDAGRIALAGTSRLGKAALWAGANDERAALTIATVSGTCGAAMSRSNTSEQIADLNANFRWWMSDAFKEYNDRVDELPVDQHELIACIAPRKVYISSAQVDTSNDSQGTWNALMMSRDAFRLYGLGVLEGDMGPQPAVGEPVFSESMAYHIRTGNHGINAEDWNNYWNFMDEYLLPL